MFRKVCIVSLFFVIPLALIFAGGTSQPGTPVQTSGPARISVAITEDIRILDYKTNYMTQILERDANVDLDFVMYPSVDYNARINLMVMAGGNELQDIVIVSPGDATVYQWGQEKAIIPLTKYIRDPRTSPYTHDALQRTGVNFLPQITSPDGEIYGLPQFNMSYTNEVLDRIWYYTPWLDQLGMKVPETTEDYYNVLRAVVSRDMNGNGRADEIGLAGIPYRSGITGEWFRFLMNSFEYAGDRSLFTVKNGRVSVPYNTPEWREGLKYMRRLFQEGLIVEESLTMDRNQLVTLLTSNPGVPRIFSFGAQSSSLVGGNNPIINDYMFLPPLRGPAGVQYVSFVPSTASVALVISANCRNPDAAFRVADLMMSKDVGIMQRWGAEGLDWDYPENVSNIRDFVTTVPGYPISLVAYDDTRFWAGTTVTNGSWRQKGPFVRSYEIAMGMGILPGTSFEEISFQAAKFFQEGPYKPAEYVSKLIYTTAENEAIRDIQVSLNNYVTEMTSAFLAGNRDIDGYWNTYIAELNNIGLARYLTVNQTVYDRMK